MKIAITCQDKDLDSMIDQRFGRCRYFLVVDIEDNKIKEVSAVVNKGAEQGHGAGLMAGEQIAEIGAEAILTGKLGPNASNIIQKLGIKAYHASGKAEDAVKEFLDGKLSLISEIAEPHQTPDEETVDNTDKRDKKMFIPLLDNKGMDSKISDHFGHAPFFGIYNLEKNDLEIIENDLEHTDPTLSPIDQIEKLCNPEAIFAKGIGGRAIDLIQEKGICLKTGNFDTVKEVIENLDKLDEQTQSCGHEH